MVEFTLSPGGPAVTELTIAILANYYHLSSETAAELVSGVG